MDEENELYLNKEEYLQLIQKCEDMFESKSETYFDVFEFIELLDYYIEEGKLNKAYSLISIGLKQHPNNSDIEFRKAKIYIERNDADAALETIKKLIKFEDSNSDFYLINGIAYAMKGDFELATLHFNTAIEKDPDELEDNLYNTAVTFLNYNQYELALKYLLEAHEKFPSNILVIYDIAYCYERMQDIPKSLEYYKLYIDLDPYSEHAWYNLALIYIRLDQYDEAINAFDYALAINDSFSSAHFNKGNCLANIEKYSDAIESYLEFLNIEPNNVMALLYVGECYEKLNDFENALTYFTKVTDLSPDFGEGWYGLALIHFFDGDYALAKKHFEKALELEADNDKFWISYGILLKELNLIDEAIGSFKKAISLNPEEFEAWLQYSQLEYELNNIAHAKNILFEALKNNQNPAFHYTLAAYFANEKNYEKAIYHFQHGFELDNELSSFFFDICHLPPDKLDIFHDIIFK